MPRVGGGGGPLVPPRPGGAQGTQGAQKSDFASKIQQTAQQGTDAARTQQAKQTQQSSGPSKITGKAKEIAQRLQQGDIDQKQATREFVGVVIEERFPQLKKRKRQGKDDDQSPEEQLEEAITELIDDDPVLANRLSAQFKKLAGKGGGRG